MLELLSGLFNHLNSLVFLVDFLENCWDGDGDVENLVDKVLLLLAEMAIALLQLRVVIIDGLPLQQVLDVCIHLAEGFPKVANLGKIHHWFLIEPTPDTEARSDKLNPDIAAV